MVIVTVQSESSCAAYLKGGLGQGGVRYTDSKWKGGRNWSEQCWVSGRPSNLRHLRAAWNMEAWAQAAKPNATPRTDKGDKQGCLGPVQAQNQRPFTQSGTNSTVSLTVTMFSHLSSDCPDLVSSCQSYKIKGNVAPYGQRYKPGVM